MKKLNVLFCASVVSMSLAAQNKNVQILVGPDVLVEYQLVNMSANGRWACGNVNDGDGRGFIWDLVNDEITQVVPLGQSAPVLDVSNDGTLVGLFTTDEATENGAPIEVGGYYKDGKWHYLPNCGIVNGISDNGQYMAGVAQFTTAQGTTYRAATWTLDGTMTIWGEKDNVISGAYDVNNDGTMVCGYSYHPVRKNRTPTLWTPDSVLLDYESVGPNSLAWNFSPDGKKVLGGFLIYDIESKAKTRVDISGLKGFRLYRVTNSGMAVGEYVTMDNEMMGAAFVKDGVVYDLQEHLEKLGVDLTGWTLLQCDGISEDEQTFAVNAYDSTNVPRPLIIKLNANTTNPAPVSLKANHFEGSQVCRLTWEAPLANAAGVKGYKLWRNGTLLAELPADQLAYYDRALANGEYEYHISAVYVGSESEKSLPATAVVADFALRTPRGLNAVQAGIRDVRLFWTAPLANVPALKYGSSEDLVVSFGGGDYSFEQAVRFDSEDLSVYNGTVTDVTFYPMSKQKSWKVNFYTAKDTALFASEVLDDSNLVYGTENTVRLKNPVKLPEGEDVYVGIFVDVNGFGGYAVLGAIFHKYRAGYTDLLRREGEDTFMSLYEHAINLPDTEGAYEYPITFPIGICMGVGEQTNENQVTSYKVYLDGAEVAQTEALNHRQKKVADGTHTFGVAAVYNDGKVTAPTTLDMTVAANVAAYKKISSLQLQADQTTLKATWEAPVDDDETWISYSGEDYARGLAPSGDNGYCALYAASYDKDNLGDYEGYLITDVRFYPTSDAEFAIVIHEDGEEILWKDLERGKGYVKGMWNTIKLDQPIKVKANAEYTLIIDCYDVTPGEAPIGMDDLPAFESESDLYSMDGGETFKSLSRQETSDGKGNWMIGMIIRSEESAPMPIAGYNVLIDKKQVNTTPIKETTYSHEVGMGTHQIRVDVVYEENSLVVAGTTCFINMDEAAGVELVEKVVTLSATDTQVTILGGVVTGVKAYNQAGALVAQTNGNTLDIAHLESGIYLLTAVVDGQEMQRKICVK